MKVLIADSLSDIGLEALRAAGHEVLSRPDLKGDGSLAEAIAEERPHVLVVRSTKVREAALSASSTLELIVRAGAGYDTIDVEAASNLGIFVANCPGKNSAAVAELALGLLMSLDRSIPDNVLDAREGRWDKKRYSKAAGIKGRTLGIVGVGNIGAEVIRRAQAFDLHVVAWSRSLTPARAATLGIERRDSPQEVAAAADVVSLHVAATPDTRHLADRAFFEAMKPGAFFINTTRGSVVDEEALRWALDEKDVRAALDVFENEPAHKQGDFEHPLAAHPNVYLTHHIGASTQQAQDATAEEAARVVLAYDETGEVPNCVNLAEQTPARFQLTVRHLDKVGVLAAVLDEMRKAEWNVQEMDNLIFEGARAASANIRFDGEMDHDVVRRIEEHEDVLAVSVIDL